MDEQNEIEQTKSDSSDQVSEKNRSFVTPIIILAVFAMAAVAYYYYKNSDTLGLNGSGTVVTNVEGTNQPFEIENLPDVIAVVNGVEILKEEVINNIEQTINMASQQGIDVSNDSIMAQIKQQGLDQAINNLLLEQAAAEAGVAATAEAVEAELAQVRSQFADEEAFAAGLSEGDLTLEELRENIGAQLTMNKFITESAFANLPEVTEEEARALYDQVTAGGGEGIPEFADALPQIMAQIEQQNQQAAAADFINELREAADVEITISD